jgi:hypothetical protein
VGLSLSLTFLGLVPARPRLREPLLHSLLAPARRWEGPKATRPLVASLAATAAAVGSHRASMVEAGAEVLVGTEGGVAAVASTAHPWEADPAPQAEVAGTRAAAAAMAAQLPPLR